MIHGLLLMVKLIRKCLIEDEAPESEIQTLAIVRNIEALIITTMHFIGRVTMLCEKHGYAVDEMHSSYLF